MNGNYLKDGSGNIIGINTSNKGVSSDFSYKEIGSTGTYETHGTGIAGIIGAIANNDIGITGVLPDVKIIPIQVGYETETYFASLVPNQIAALDFAINNGADVSCISSSWGNSPILVSANLSSGVYFYSLNVNGSVTTNKFTLIK